MRSYLPAAGHRSLLGLYDPISTLLGADRARAELLSQAAPAPGHRVLDIGCGTGTLVVRAKRDRPRIDVVGLDPDRDALARARRKAERAGVEARFVEGFSDALPFDEGSFDRVLSSFMFHHLAPEAKSATLREIRRVLAPGGSFHLVDFLPVEDSWLARRLPWNHHSRGNAPASILALLVEAGFDETSHVGTHEGLLERVGYFRARTRPA